MRTVLAALLLALGLALGSLTPVVAHDDPCASGGPGHSDYAQHHIVANAEEGNLGNDGHNPGREHRGYSGIPALCENE
jgi:hypothetical protein